MHRHPVEGSFIKKEHTMLNALLTRWTRSRPSTSSSFGRAAAGDSLWQSLLRLIPGDAEPQPTFFNNMPAARAGFEACLAGLHGDSIDELMLSVRRSRSLRDLWHLRTWVYTEVARAFSQHEAEARLAVLNRHFVQLASSRKH